ncbi:MAG: hypothetical protein WCC48_01965, partial [Anaeromyxobacteraceae bacterium]
MSVRSALWWLGALALLAGPSAGAGQVARVAAEPGPGGTVVGRVCLDLDGDGTCRADEPGIGGARLRFDDGRSAVADDEGRFHAVDVTTRIVLSDRSAYGAHAVAVDGLGVRRSFELAPRGITRVELPVPVASGDGEAGSVEPRGRGAPRAEPGRILWPIGGTASPGSRVRSAGVEAEAGPDGRWALTVPLAEGLNALGLTVATAEGGLALWALELRVARPASGPLRVYPARPRKLAVMRSRLAGDGALIAGRASPGVEVRVGGRLVNVDGDGRFGAWGSATGGTLTVSATSGGATTEGSVAVAPADAFEWLLAGELELQLGGSAGFLASGRAAASVRGRWRGLRLDGGLDLDDRDRSVAALASPRDSLAAQLVVDPLRSFANAGDQGSLGDSNPGRGRLWARVEGDGAALLLGNVRSGLAKGELGTHDLALFGGRVEGGRALGPVRLDGLLFGGRAGEDANGLAPGAPSQDVLLATGGSLFYLRHTQIVAGSEAVRVEWRDPLSRLVVASRVLTRGRDYELDPVGGRLLLARPLAASRPVVALVGGDPFAAAEGWLVVDYLRIEAATGGDERGVAGGEL